MIPAIHIAPNGCIVVVTGGRDYAWDAAVDDVMLVMLLSYHSPIAEFWHGGAVGVDEHAARVATRFQIPTRVFLPEPRLAIGDAIAHALLERNARMMDEVASLVNHENRRGVVFAFPGQNGTDNAVRHAIRRSLCVVDLRCRPYRKIVPR